MGPVVEWARRWLGITQLVAENRRLTAEVQRNVAVAEKVAARAQATGDPDALGRVFAVLRRGR